MNLIGADDGDLEGDDSISSWASFDLVFAFMFILIGALLFTAIRPGFDLPNTGSFIVGEIDSRVRRDYPHIGALLVAESPEILRTPSLFAWNSSQISTMCISAAGEAIFDDGGNRVTGEAAYAAGAYLVEHPADLRNRDLPSCLTRSDGAGLGPIEVPPSMFVQDLTHAFAEVVREFLPESRGGIGANEVPILRYKCEQANNRKCPGAISMILIEGHADRTGSPSQPDHNDVLSSKRAASVLNLMIQDERLSAAKSSGSTSEGAGEQIGRLFVAGGFGCRRPVFNVGAGAGFDTQRRGGLDKECPAAGDPENALESKNRRVDIRVIVPVGREE